MEEVLEGIDEAYGTLLRCFNDIIKPYMSFIGNLNMPIEIDGKEFTSFDSAVEHVKKTKKNIKDPEKYVATIERTKRKAKQLSARKVYVDDDEYEEANKRLDQLNQVGRNNPSLRSPLESPEAMDLEEEYIQSGVKINPSRKSSGKKIDLKLRRKLAKQLSAERKIYVRDDEYEKAKQRLRNLARVDRDNPSLRRPMQKPEAFELEEKYIQSGVKIDPSRRPTGKKIDRRLRKRLASLADEAAKRRIRETNLTGVPYGKENRKTKQIEHDEALRTYIEGAARKYNIKIRPPEGFPHPSSSKPKRKDFIRIIKAQLSARKNHLPRFLRDNDDEDDDDFPLTDKAVKRHWYLGHDRIPLRDRAAERKVKETNLTGVPYGIEDRKMVDIERDEEKRTFFENAIREYPVDFYKNPIKIRPPEGFSYEPRFDLDILHTWMGNPHQSENAPRKPSQKHFIRIIKAKIQNAKEQLIAKEHEHQVVFKKAGKKGIYKSASLVSNDGIFAKYWLLNAKQVNGNGWGVDPQTIKQNIIKFRGRPFVITAKEWIPNSEYGETYEHPYLPTNDINEILTHQAKFRVGNIVDVFEDKNGDWYASIQIQSKYANYRLPPFCSPAIFQLDPSEPEGSISKWEALHLAGLMEDPAYGARIALLKGTCIGNSNSCSVQFKGAKQLNRTNNSRSKIAEREAPRIKPVRYYGDRSENTVIIKPKLFLDKAGSTGLLETIAGKGNYIQHNSGIISDLGGVHSESPDSPYSRSVDPTNIDIFDAEGKDTRNKILGTGKDERPDYRKYLPSHYNEDRPFKQEIFRGDELGTIEYLKRRIRSGQPIERPFLDLNKNVVTSHEGRHRSRALMEEGENVEVDLNTSDEFFRKHPDLIYGQKNSLDELMKYDSTQPLMVEVYNKSKKKFEEIPVSPETLKERLTKIKDDTRYPILGRTSKLKSKLVRLANQRFAAPIIQETGEGITFRKIRPFSQPDIKKFGDYKIPMRPDNAFLIRPHNPDYSVKIMKELRKIQNTELPRFTHGTTGQNSIRIRDVGNLSVLGYPLRRQSTISHALGKTLQKGDILFRRVGAQPVDQYTYGAVGDTFHIDEEIPNASPFNLPKPRYSKLKARLAIMDVSEPFKRERFLGNKPHVLHPEHYEIEQHAEKLLGVSPKFSGVHFLTTDGKLLGNGNMEHRTMSYKILSTYNDPEFKKMADEADAKTFSRWGTDGRNMSTLLEKTGMARVSADKLGINIDAKHPLTKSQLSTINEHIAFHNITPNNIFIDDDTPGQNTIKRQLRIGQLQYKYAGMRDVIKAFMEKKPLVSGNHKTDGKAYFLFGHEIARHEGSGLSVTNAGYPTPTTYNTLADIGVDFRIIKGVTYVEGKPYNDGDHVLIPYKNLKPREPKPKKTNSDGKDHSMSFKMRRFIRDVRKEQGNVSQLSITPDEQRMINKITGVNTPIPKPVPGTEGHHIFTREVFPELGFVKNNIITVSRSEHKEIHDLNRHITDKSFRRKRKKLKSKIAALIKEHPIVSNLRKIKNVGTYGSLFIADDGAILGNGISTHYGTIFSPSINPGAKYDKDGFFSYNNTTSPSYEDFQKIMQDTRLIRMHNSPRELNLDVYASPTTSQIKTMRDLTIPPYNRSDFYVHINSHVPELPETRLYRMLGVAHYGKQIKTKFAHDYTPDDVGGLGGAMTPEQRARALHLVDLVQKNRKLQEFMNSPEGREANRLYVNKGIKINPKKWLEKTRRQEAKIICPKKLKEKISKIKLARSRYIIQQPQHVKINPQHGQIIANAYDALKHEPNNPEVKSAYDAFIRETEQQFEGLIKGGLKIKRIGDNVKPYSSSSELHADLAEKNELRYFPTVAGYGQGSEPKDHPMLRPTRFKDPVTNQTLLANDVFRIVHDVRGHHIGGLSGFGPTGEQRAFLTHSKDYSPLARKALFTETTAQTNWIVFSKQFGRLNRLNPEKMRYPQQKAGILPRDILEGVFHT